MAFKSNRDQAFRAAGSASREPKGGSLVPTVKLNTVKLNTVKLGDVNLGDVTPEAAAHGTSSFDPVAVVDPPARDPGPDGIAVAGDESADRRKVGSRFADLLAASRGKGRQAESRQAEISREESNWVLGRSAAMRGIARSIERAAEVECTVLVRGETGTGKELWARLLHRSGPRRDRAFIPVNCAALTESLAESQLFGHEKGAFTGAEGRSLGIFRAAQGGIVFLDEIGEMPMSLQPKLLRVLQQREVIPVGSTQPVPVDVQIVAATNRDLEHEVEKGGFREDLYYRLNMIELVVPSLRDRVEDIPEFIQFFSKMFAEKYRLPAWEPTPEELAAFCSFDWPGNVRQLSHAIEQAYVLQVRPQLPKKRVDAAADESGKVPTLDLVRLRRLAIKQALEATRGHKARAAKLLGVHANTLTRMLKEDGEPSEGDR